jgi:hypothetical protein
MGHYISVLHLRKQVRHDNPVNMKHPIDSPTSGLLKLLIAGIILIALPQMLFAYETVNTEKALQLIETPLFETKDAIPHVSLERPLVFENAIILWPDRDEDGLDDVMETSLAEIVRPFFIFDSREKALDKNEPVTLFQVRPVDLSVPDNMSIRIRWVLLFRNNGGYGPCSALCGGSHKGDIKVITCNMISNDSGLTWETMSIALGEKETIIWKKGFDKISSKMSHPVIFISSGRHNPYFFPAPDGISSAYSTFGCCDNVDGKGTAKLPDIKNAGEPEFHPEPDFTNSLAPVFPEYSAWGTNSFFSIWTGNISDKWLKNEILPRDALLCSLESLSSPGNFVRHKRYFGEVSKIQSARDRLDARFRIIPAAGVKDSFTIESVNYPGYFFADRNGRLSLIKPGSEEENMAVIFKMGKGLNGRGSVSFESAGEKGSYILEKEGHLFVEPRRGKSFKKNASFRMRSPQ